MIYPTSRAVYCVAAAAPVALALGVIFPAGWALILLWIVLIVVLIVADALLTPGIRTETLAVEVPGTVAIGQRIDPTPPASARTRFAVEAEGPLTPAPDGGFVAARRGRANLGRIWARRHGPLGLAWRQKSRRLDQPVIIAPDLGPVREQGMRQYLRSSQMGERMRLESGDGSEFQALTDFQPGMERRTIDWKASARHISLLAREYRTERANSIVLAVDAGRAMSDPLDGVPRIDRAVSAALLTAFVGLRSGDRVRLFSFGARPQADSGTITGAKGFARLQQAASAIDYTQEESNYTLSLITLDGRLHQRSLIILFTEFTDPTAAELMVAAARRMLKRHRVLFVLFEDNELIDLQRARPEQADDVVRSNVASVLLRERRIVIERLRRLGIDVIEARHDALPLALVEHYLRLRMRA
ncbi:DUF58 domain-containing protein [Stakelama pacifica]|uniref:Uncharacterized protein (DUF58 family) n=1 Tax=Stakelama pacifica TaxID=517720 RepID=A0A4R6FD52_9SPHN|nr:DUF58 domain-containing protein [Stakelama pacifica]TDN79063.1 uncharacterized protein (DUF58 family) [Stakelama pacifica]GGO98707.1 hypothetical protein GCM10011329_30490 [Stakelama pacifica]